MFSYSFSIFARGFLAFSGFLVFIVTASLYGAEGRGIIGYGTSIFASIGTFLCLSLGRVYLAGSIAEPNHKIRFLSKCITLNIVGFFMTIGLGLLFWLVSPTAQSVLTFNQVMAFSLTSSFFIWCHTGQHYYSSIAKTKTQDILILFIRFILILFLIILFFLKPGDISVFLWGYSIILFSGCIIEIYILKKITGLEFPFRTSLKEYGGVLKKIHWAHLDFISFNTFPLILTVIAAIYLNLQELGRVNFAIQIINLVFLLSTTANMRVTTYVAHGGIQQRMRSFKILFFLTLISSFFEAVIIYYLLKLVPYISTLQSFSGVSTLFFISTLSIPGFALFQFMNPIWIEIGELKLASILSTTNLLFCLMLTPPILKSFHENGFVWLFSLFHINTFFIQYGIYFFKFKISRTHA